MLRPQGLECLSDLSDLQQWRRDLLRLSDQLDRHHWGLLHLSGQQL